MITTQLDENDETLPDPPLWRVVKASAPEWYLIVVGVIASAVDGISFPLVSIFMGRIFEVGIINFCNLNFIFQCIFKFDRYFSRESTDMGK